MRRGAPRRPNRRALELSILCTAVLMLEPQWLLRALACRPAEAFCVIGSALAVAESWMLLYRPGSLYTPMGILYDIVYGLTVARA